MYNPFPMSYGDINYREGHLNPSPVMPYNNETFDYWVRSLFQRACSVLEFGLPDDWSGSIKDYFYYVIFHDGHMAVSDLAKYGYVFQPCNLYGFNIYRQPTNALISNPYMDDVYDLTIGKECEIIKLTPDYMGIWDVIEYFAKELAGIKGDLETAMTNAKLSHVLYSSTKGGGEALKKVLDMISKGSCAVVADQRITMDPNSKDTPLQFMDLTNVSFKAVDSIEKFLMNAQTILNNFDTEIGIPTIPYQKKERMVTSEADSKIIDATSRSIVWYNTLQDSIKKVNKLYPDKKPISVKLRFDPDDMMVQTEQVAKSDNSSKEGSDV